MTGGHVEYHGRNYGADNFLSENQFSGVTGPYNSSNGEAGSPPWGKHASMMMTMTTTRYTDTTRCIFHDDGGGDDGDDDDPLLSISIRGYVVNKW